MRRSLSHRFLIVLPISIQLAACTSPEGGDGTEASGFTTFTTGAEAEATGEGEGEGTSDTNGEAEAEATTAGDGDGDSTTTTAGDGDGDATTAGDGDGDATTAGDGDGDGDATTAGDGDGDGSADGTTDGCFNEELSFQPFPPSIVLVLDKSGSMQGLYDHDGNAGTPNVSRWNAVHQGVTQILNNYDAQVEFGLKLFPSDTSCGVDAGVDVTCAPNNGANVLGAMPAATFAVNGSTPSGEGLARTLDYLTPLQTQGNKAIIFMADGDVSCGTPGTIADMSTLLSDAYNGGGANSIPTYVVGINATGTTVDELNDLANAGGVPIPGGAPGCNFANTSVAVPAGTTTVTFEYDKDGSVNTGSDRVWIDNLSLDVGGTIEFADDYETGVFSGAYTQAGAQPWAVDGSSVAGGAFAAHSGAIGANEQSTVQLQVTTSGAGSLAFDYRTSTEGCCDDLNVRVGATNSASFSGTSASTCPAQFYDTQNFMQFFDALDAIIGNLVTCDLILDPPPPFPDNIDVNIAGMDVMQLDPAAPGFDCATQVGWYYSSPNVVTLCGSTCTDFKALSTPSADITYFCTPN